MINSVFLWFILKAQSWFFLFYYSQWFHSFFFPTFIYLTSFCITSFFSFVMICFVSQARLVALGRLQQLLLHQGPLLALLLLPTPQVSSIAAFNLNKKNFTSFCCNLHSCAQHKFCPTEVKIKGRFNQLYLHYENKKIKIICWSNYKTDIDSFLMWVFWMCKYHHCSVAAFEAGQESPFSGDCCVFHSDCLKRSGTAVCFFKEETKYLKWVLQEA